MDTSLSDSILIRSADRTSSSASSSNFQIQLPVPLKDKYLLIYSLIPNSLYNVDSTNNVIYWRENSTNKTGTVTPGTYTYSSITTAIKSAMDTGSGVQTFTVTFSSTTNKLTVVASVSAIIFQFGTFTTNSARKVMGYNAVDSSSSLTQVSPNIIDLSLPISLGINIRESSQSSFWATGSGLQSASFYIPFITGSGQYQSLNTQDLPQTIEFKQGTRILNITVTDLNGNIVNLNGLNWEFFIRKVGKFIESVPVCR